MSKKKESIKLGDITYILARLGNLELLSLAVIKDPTKLMTTLIKKTVIEPRLTDEAIDNMPREHFCRLLERIVELNEFSAFEKLGKKLKTSYTI